MIAGNNESDRIENGLNIRGNNILGSNVGGQILPTRNMLKKRTVLAQKYK